MSQSNAQATWAGDLKKGKGSMETGSGVVSAPFDAGTRFGGEPGTNPEELIGAALAGCFSMALSAGLGEAGFTPTSIDTKAAVTMEKVADGFAITKIELKTDASIPNIDKEKFQSIADETKKGCPVAKALSGTKIELQANLK